MFKTGDIVFFRTGSFLGKAIQKIAGIKYNHVGTIVMWDNVPMVCEALGRGVISTPLSVRIDETDKMVIKRPDRDINEVEFTKKAINYLGHTPYDFVGLLWHQLVWNLTGKWISKQTPEEAEERFYCYEYSAMLDGYPEWWKVSPKEFFDFHKTVIYEK